MKRQSYLFPSKNVFSRKIRKNGLETAVKNAGNKILERFVATVSHVANPE